MTLRKALITVAAAASLTLATAGAAHAGTDCTAAVDGNGEITLDLATAANGTFHATPIYIAGSTALEPMIKATGKLLATQTNAKPYVLIYDKDGSCSGVNRLINGTPPGNIANTGASSEKLLYIPPDFDGKNPIACTQTNNVTASLILSDVDAKLCPGVTALPAGYMDFHGPVNDMVFIVPPHASAKGISAEMAYLIFGKGMAGMVTPYVDPAAFFIRSKDSGTRAMINAAIGLTTHDWIGDTGVTTAKPNGYGSGDVYNAVKGADATAPDKTLGILGEDFYDGNDSTDGTSVRSHVMALPFRAFKQHLAYWPDSTQSSRDRRNVRDGRYGIWGFVHMISTATSGTPSNASAKYFIDMIQGNLASPPPGLNALDATIASHLTPACAMNVTHDIEGAPSMPYTDPAPCGCYFESKATGTTPTTCKTCSGDPDCAGNANGTHCRYGYCEAH